MPNILLTSAGKRVELINEFQKELYRYFRTGKVLTTDMNPEMAPACLVSDRYFTVPSVLEKSYIPQLLNLCVENKVKLVVPTIDTELLVLAENRHLFSEQGVDIMISDLPFISICRDKRKTEKLFLEIGIKVPEVRNPEEDKYPIFVKPFDGSLSTDIHILYSREDLTPELLNNRKLIYREYIDPKEYKEFTVDLYWGKDSKIKSIVPRERLAVRAGEMNRGITRKNFLVDYLKEKLSQIKDARGVACLQVFYRDQDNDVVGIELNPRFGGGYPLSYYSGANYPEMLIKEYLNGEELEYTENWRDSTLMLRYDSQIIL